ncbi:MAG: class I SAM-dependent methyltransferase [Acidobacteriota bacterium]
MKPEYYYNNTRVEILQYLPKAINRHLDIGCAAGMFGKIVKKKYGCESWGIEYTPQVAELAKQNIDHAYSGDCKEILPKLNERFDCVTMLDVFEHIAEGDGLLKLIRTVMDDDSTLVISVPNILYARVALDLFFHRDFQYQECGVLDDTHLRFFTRKSICRQLENAGYKIDAVHSINETQDWRFPLKVLDKLTRGRFNDFRYQQYVISATV